MVGIAMPPKADNPRLDPNLLGNRPGAAPGRRQQNDPSPLQIALQCHRRAATCLKHLAIFLRKLDFSCFGYHPDVESRLTLYEKWVLERCMRRLVFQRLKTDGAGFRPLGPHAMA
jgi:hypothetical protein